MKKYIIICSCIMTVISSFGQQFTQVNGGRIVATRSDSRSVNFIDINDDGWEDIFISNGLEGGQNDLLYINNGDGRFTAITNGDIVTDNLPSVGASFADYDNDGHMDGFVTNWYGEVDGLFTNDGSGELAIVNNSIVRRRSFAEASAWGDYNNDGLVDLYVTNSAGSRQNFLFKNLGNGNFEEITEGALVLDKNASRSVNWIDFNGDGHLDLFVGNENNTSNDLYVNLGNGTFSASSIGGIRSTFSSSWADFDNDGDLDLFLANNNLNSGQNNQLLRNDNGDFNQVPSGTAHTDGGCSNGSAFGDYDNDGDLDLIVTNGFCGSNTNFLYENQGNGVMIRSNQELPGLRDVCSYGVAWGDINNDGFLDLMIANCKNNRTDAEVTNDLYMNNGNTNHWFKIKLQGMTSNWNAIGAIINLKSSDIWQTRQVSSQSGYSGQNSLWAHFGMGEATLVDSLVIKWPGGGQNIITNIPADQHMRLQENLSTAIAEVSERSTFRMACWPNPVSINQQKMLVIVENQYQNRFNNITLIMSDINGNKVFEKHINGRIGQNAHQIEVDIMGLALSPGMYIIRALNGKYEDSQKIIVF